MTPVAGLLDLIDLALAEQIDGLRVRCRSVLGDPAEVRIRYYAELTDDELASCIWEFGDFGLW